jgi:hypothetical protein
VSGIKCHRFPRTELRLCLSDTEKPMGMAPESLGMALAGVMRRAGLTGGDFLSAHGYRGGVSAGMVVAPPLQLGVVGLYLVWGT